MENAGYKVLIIEDRRENIVFLANNIFKPKGFEIITAMDGETGLRKALEESPDLIFTDLNLPKMRGLDILEDLQDRGSVIPSIVMTFHGSEETAIKAFRLGARDYLIKPFSVEDVERALERALGTRSKMSVSSEPDTTALQQRITDLEQMLSRQQAASADQTPPADTVQLLEQKLAEQEQVLERCKVECTRLKTLLNQQQQLTSEARNSAKAMIQFIRAQHKEILRQKTEADRLSHQLTALSNGVDKLMARLDRQMHQFQIVSPHSDR
jgi:DNA-binding response OmpR family regulator